MNLKSASSSRGATTGTTCQTLASIGARHMLPAIDDLAQYCIFLDLDGTLVEIEDRPDDVRVDPATLEFIEQLREKVGRALAVVSGRDIHAIDRLLHPLVLPVAGVHGLQRRDAAGRLHSPTIDQSAVEAIATRVEAAFLAEPGVVIERKAGAVAIHYRLRPDFERKCQAVAQKIVRDRADLNLITGKMVCEIRLHGNNKGGVIGSFLEERPFKGRRPIFAGDDVTDESGFLTVNACGGVSIKIGEELTAARYRAANVLELRNWFDALIAAPGDLSPPRTAGAK
ncbi:trehalose-phosphatase [Rhodoblastus sp. 17X3]|uniref:trehalose-phosphatase n=1 Tax=Rhodoblastus sp. 17X3 TaxID=3047026 RepID=UPI0024B7CBCF|nr:trehalose-phosphatase [Rhodoblastus sp. 17X3]MDI9847667.1 trehalose-phosphatase [Rhodoblastus sp. 17X3]